MRSHPGQVSFPGGAIDPGETPREAALREAEEETGLRADGVEVFAELPELWLPPSNFAVTPVLGWWREETPVGVVDPGEVHAVYRVPLDELLDPTHRISVRQPERLDRPRLPDRARTTTSCCWGFTAGIIARLLDFLGWTTALGRGARCGICPPTCCRVDRRPATSSRTPTLPRSAR